MAVSGRRQQCVGSENQDRDAVVAVKRQSKHSIDCPAHLVLVAAVCRRSCHETALLLYTIRHP